jgi:hypothetical protein
VRRSSDLLLSIVALVLIVFILSLIRTLPTGSTELSNDVSRWLRHIPRWLSSGAEVIAALGCIAVVVVAMVALVRNDIRSALNAASGAAVAAVAAILATSIWRSEHGAVTVAVLHHSNPSIFVVDTALVALLVVSDLARRARWTHWYFLSGAGLLLAGVAVDSLTPFAVVIVLFGGLLFGWGLRWALGALSVRPSIPELINWLSDCRLSKREYSALRCSC